MARLMLIGADAALLEGLAQSLCSAGHTVRIAQSPAEAVGAHGGAAPLALIVDGDLVAGAQAQLRSLLAGGAALLLYHGAGGPRAVPAALQRAVVADLALPLERHRLVAIVDRLAERARLTGRGRSAESEEGREAR